MLFNRCPPFQGNFNTYVQEIHEDKQRLFVIKYCLLTFKLIVTQGLFSLRNITGSNLIFL